MKESIAGGSMTGKMGLADWLTSKIILVKAQVGYWWKDGAGRILFR